MFKLSDGCRTKEATRSRDAADTADRRGETYAVIKPV